MFRFDYSLTAHEFQQMNSIDAKSWFTQFAFRETVSPRHPEADLLDSNHELKRKLVLPWIREKVKNKRVLDLFCANGAFSFEAALAGAREVVGVEFSEERIHCARFIAGTFPGKIDCAVPKFLTGNVYELRKMFPEPFDVVLALGGLYHIADPPFVLSQIRSLTAETLIVQTSSILRGTSNHARFVIRPDMRSRGLTSVIGGQGAWQCTAPCFENMLRHAGFKIVESLRPPFWSRKRFPWYCALAEPM